MRFEAIRRTRDEGRGKMDERMMDERCQKLRIGEFRDLGIWGIQDKERGMMDDG